jgi:hypothetical protein
MRGIYFKFDLHGLKFFKYSLHILFTLTNQSKLIPESWEEYPDHVGFVAPATTVPGSLNARKSLAAECWGQMLP